jgi:hypothetical protein
MLTTAALSTLWRTIGRLGFTVRNRTRPCGHWQTHTVIAALRWDGRRAPAVFDGPIDSPTFLGYVEQVLVSRRGPGDIMCSTTWPSMNRRPCRPAMGQAEAFVR